MDMKEIHKKSKIMKNGSITYGICKKTNLQHQQENLYAQKVLPYQCHTARGGTDE